MFCGLRLFNGGKRKEFVTDSFRIVNVTVTSITKVKYQPIKYCLLEGKVSIEIHKKPPKKLKT